MKFDREKLFRLAVWLKGLDGLGEILAGLGLLLIGPTALSGWVHALTFGEISEDPTDFFATQLRQAAEAFSTGGETFVVGYLVIHGLIKIGLVVALLRHMVAAYPAAIAVLGGFLAFQLWRYLAGGSVLLLLLSVFDIFVIVLVWREWRALTRQARGA